MEVPMKKILIVDDSLFMRKILRDMLSGMYAIIEADSGVKAIEQFKKEKPDLVLLDIVMPQGEEEGVKVLKLILAINSAAKVIMVTAVGQDLMIEECRKLGVRDYIVKPFDDERILQTVEKCLGPA
jgi:two-component system, chemotaxis family, chemotaxis protein CheY